jgi:two-component sensor histidine kinase
MEEREPVAALAAASAKAGGSLERTMLRSGGTEVAVSLSCSAMRTTDGALQGHILVAQDLTRLKAAEAQLRESLGEKELLLREVHHRVKNNMQVISSLLAMQSTSGDPEVLRKLEDSQNRIRTIALIHEQLYQQTELARIDTQSYLQVLAQHLIQSYGKTEQVRLELDVDNLNLDLDQSLACGLIVNELLTNAFKYAFADGRHGKVSLRLKDLGDGTRLLEVADDGQGFQPKTGEKRRTLGTSLVSKLARQLRGRVITSGEGGVTVKIVFEGAAKAEAVTA